MNHSTTDPGPSDGLTANDRARVIHARAHGIDPDECDTCIWEMDPEDHVVFHKMTFKGQRLTQVLCSKCDTPLMVLGNIGAALCKPCSPASFEDNEIAVLTERLRTLKRRENTLTLDARRLTRALTELRSMNNRRIITEKRMETDLDIYQKAKENVQARWVATRVCLDQLTKET